MQALLCFEFEGEQWGEACSDRCPKPLQSQKVLHAPMYVVSSCAVH